MLSMTGIAIMSRGQVHIAQASKRLKERFGPVTYKRVIGMVEAARTFVLAALFIN
jgi:hypothetical protein